MFFVSLIWPKTTVGKVKIRDDSSEDSVARKVHRFFTCAKTFFKWTCFGFCLPHMEEDEEQEEEEGGKKRRRKSMYRVIIMMARFSLFFLFSLLLSCAGIDFLILCHNFPLQV